MDDQVFIDRVKEKIERLTGREIDLQLDPQERSRLDVDPSISVPKVVLGSDALKYAGFARMAVEYAVASIRRGSEVPPLEFQTLLSRN